VGIDFHQRSYFKKTQNHNPYLTFAILRKSAAVSAEINANAQENYMV
jgi:hypothetical protein